MSFTLIIKDGKSEGKTFSFTKDKVGIGRLPDNDLVLYNTGVSRHHCQIEMHSSEKYSIADLGSANGVVINQQKIQQKTLLNNGDIIEIGPAMFEFHVGDTQPRGVPGQSEKYDSDAPSNAHVRQAMEQHNTEAFNSNQVAGLQDLQQDMAAKRRGRKRRTLSSAGQEEEEDNKPKTARERAAARRAARRRKRTMDKGEPPPEEKPVEAPAPEAPQNPADPALAETAASGLMARQPPARKRLLGIIGGLAILILVGGIVYALLPKSVTRSDHSKDIINLTREAGKKTYGFGPVAVQCHDKVNFRFNYSGGLAILHYAVAGIDAPNELAIYINGKLSGYAPLSQNWLADLKFKIPRKLLKPHTTNMLTFDSTANPPESNSWGVAQIVVVEKGLPEPDPPRAMKFFMLGQTAHKSQRVDPANLSKAIEYYDDAMLFLEKLDPKPPLYGQITLAMDEAEASLKQIYDTKMFSAYRAERSGDFKTAREEYQDLLRYLPNVEDERRQETMNKLKNLGAGAH